MRLYETEFFGIADFYLIVESVVSDFYFAGGLARLDCFAVAARNDVAGLY